MLLSSLSILLILATTALTFPLAISNNPCSPPTSNCPLARAVYPEFPRAYPGVEMPDNNITVAVTLGIGNFTHTCRNSVFVPSPRAALYDVSPLLLASRNQTSTKSSLVSSAFLTGAPPAGQAVDDYIGFHSPVSYTNTTPAVVLGPCGEETVDETPRTVDLPFFILYRASPSCPSEGVGEKRGTFRSVGRFPSPRAREGFVGDVDWQQFEVVEGNSYATANTGIAPTVVMTDTRGGNVTEVGCDVEGATIVKPFVALFWFFR
ncbi:hypothetical protein JCM6882_003045 [Rhodosporidiobolus microsporus]